VLAFDLGGGTYDISLLEVGNGTIEVLSAGGDPHLGGDDWDAAIVQWLTREHLQPAGVDTRSPEVRCWGGAALIGGDWGAWGGWGACMWLVGWLGFAGALVFDLLSTKPRAPPFW